METQETTIDLSGESANKGQVRHENDQPQLAAEPSTRQLVEDGASEQDETEQISASSASASSSAASAVSAASSISVAADERKSCADFEINWQNLDFVLESKWYKLASQRVPILNGLSGQFKSGELSAILGPSGAGKSTLIDCLMGKRERGLRGKTWVRFKSAEVEEERRSRRPLKIATIPQEDHLLDSLSVTETFMFASRIKNAHLTYEEEEDEEEAAASSASFECLSYAKGSAALDKQQPAAAAARLRKRKRFDHFKNVQRVIQQLNLASCASTKCGKLSGGQYKRVSIGQELLSRPDVMILDEPTSGLDSVTCYQTISALRQLIESSPYPIAIVATIHQPDIEVFQLFHRCYVLAQGGRSIYEGSVGDIFDTVKLGLELVESRRQSAASKLTASRPLGNFGPPLEGAIGPISSSISSSSSSSIAEAATTALRQQLLERRSNPARLIVELAANEYGYEITTALNEIQARRAAAAAAEQQSSSYAASSSGGCSGTSSVVCSQLDLHHSEEQLTTTTTTTTSRQLKSPEFDYSSNDPKRRRAHLDKLLRLSQGSSSSSLGVYFAHLWQHTKRSWLTIVRDPMLFSVQLLLHVAVPLLISYSFQAHHRGDACPKVGPLDVVEEAFRRDGGDVLSDLNGELRVAFENLGYMFFQIYVIIFAAVCVTSLTYPLVMHVLLKEYRNGWYSMSSYFLGRTLADLPVPTFNVVLAIAISYHLTGQPMSPYGWRFLSVSGLTVLATLVAQTQGLMFGAMLMNAPQAAVFVAPASTAPLVVVSGFLIRIRSLPAPLQLLSQFSYFTHLLNGFIVSRYGFNRCPCSESDFTIEPSHQVPAQARAIIDLWIDTFEQDYQPPAASVNSSSSSSSSNHSNLVGRLVDTISRAKTFGHEMQTCDQVKPFTMLDYELNDSHLMICFVALLLMLLIYRWLTYVVLLWKINSSI